MNRIANILLPVLLLAAGINVLAQQKAKGKGDSKPETNNAGARKPFLPTVYLGNSDYSGGPVKKAVFDNLLKEGLNSHDVQGNKYKVIGFDFTYAEHSLYEDSIGNLMNLVDFTSEYCAGDSIGRDIAGSIYDRTKPGDTVFMDHIRVVRYIGTQAADESTAIMGKGLKCVIIK